MNKIPAVVITYKHRANFDTLVADLGEDVSRQIYVFCYESDYLPSGYDKVTYPSNVILVNNVPESAKGCPPMRSYVWDYLTNLGVEKFWFLDDDTSKARVAYPDGTVRKKKDDLLSVHETLDLMDPLWDSKYGVCFPNIGGLVFNYAQNPISEQACAIAAVWGVNLKVCNANNIHVSSDPIFEDMDMILQCRQKDVPTACLRNIGFTFSSVYGSKTSVLGRHYNEITLNTYKKWGSWSRIKPASGRTDMYLAAINRTAVQKKEPITYDWDMINKLFGTNL